MVLTRFQIAQERARVLLHAVQDERPPLCWQQRKCLKLRGPAKKPFQGFGGI